MTDNKQYPSVTECVRLVGGIVHSDGNIFFKNANAFIAASEAMRAAQPHDHGPQATTLEEAARDVGKWLNERPNRPLDLRHVAMLAHLAETAQPDSAAVAGPSDAFEKYVDAWKASFLSDNPFHTVVMREEDKKHILAGLNALGAPTQAAAEPWDGHKFKEVQRGLWRCNCGKQIQETAPPGKLSDGAQYRCRKCGEQNRIEFNYAGIVTRRPDGLERDPRDIESDPRGQLIHDASHPLNAASQPAVSQGDCELVQLPATEWNAMEFWLDRCEQKGHLDNCFDLVGPWNALKKAIADRDSAQPQEAATYPELEIRNLLATVDSENHIVHPRRWLDAVDRLRATLRSGAAPASQDAERFRAIIQAAIDDDDVFQTTMNQDRFKDIETLDDARRMVDAAICASSAARAQAKEGST